MFNLFLFYTNISRRQLQYKTRHVDLTKRNDQHPETKVAQTMQNFKNTGNFYHILVGEKQLKI
jgi:hypothetical protein